MFHGEMRMQRVSASTQKTEQFAIAGTRCCWKQLARRTEMLFTFRMEQKFRAAMLQRPALLPRRF